MIYIDDFCFEDNSLLAKMEKENKDMKKANFNFKKKYQTASEAFTYEGCYSIVEFINYCDEHRPRNMNELESLLKEAYNIKQSLKILSDEEFYDIENIDYITKFKGCDIQEFDLLEKDKTNNAKRSIQSAKHCIKYLDDKMNEILYDYFWNLVEPTLL